MVSKIREALDAGLNTEALDLARQAAAGDPHSPEVGYLGALASARMGATGEAERWLAQIDRDALGGSPLATEVWSLTGRIAKERYALARDKAPDAARDFARAAIDGYRHAYAIGGSAYPAVNAATMAMLSGDPALARTLAQQALAWMRPVTTGGRRVPAKRGCYSTTSTRRAAITRKPAAWPDRGMATSPRCAGSFG
jgi:hypothetical protein